MSLIKLLAAYVVKAAIMIASTFVVFVAALIFMDLILLPFRLVRHYIARRRMPKYA